METWQIIPLGELCQIELGGTPARKSPKLWDPEKNTDNVWLSIADLPQTLNAHVTDSKEYISDEASRKARLVRTGTLLVSFKLTLGRLAYAGRDLYTNEAIAALIIPDERLLTKTYLYWYLTFFDWQKAAEGDHKIKGKTLNKAKLKVLPVLVPPLREQERIVAILDEAFAAIATATANAEKNLANAREVFENYLKGIDGEMVPLGDLVNIRTGKLDANAAVEGGEYPFFTCAREVYAIDNYAFDCEAILLAGNNAVGDFNVKHYQGRFNAYQRTYVITVNERNRALYRFLYFQMMKSLKEFKSQSVGAGTKFLKLGMIKGMRIALPARKEQEKIVAKVDSILAETERIESINQKKISAHTELKQSILHKAFTGELTADAKAIDRKLSGVV